VDAKSKTFTDVIILCDCDCGGRGASSKRKVKQFSGIDFRHVTMTGNVINRIAWYNFILGPENDLEIESIERYARKQPLSQKQRDIVKPLQQYMVGCWLLNPHNKRMYKVYNNRVTASDAKGIAWVLEGYNGKAS
jgi:hypothetical protein